MNKILRPVFALFTKAARALWAAFNSGPPLRTLLPDTVEECRLRIGQIQSNPHYTFENVQFAVQLLEAREAHLRRHAQQQVPDPEEPGAARNHRAQQEHEQRQVQRTVTETGQMPQSPMPPFRGV